MSDLGGGSVSGVVGGGSVSGVVGETLTELEGGDHFKES